MRHFNRRVEALARRYGSPTHGVRLLCPACEGLGSLPDDISAALDAFITGLVTRVGRDAVRAAMAPPPSPPPCPRCGGGRSCGACQHAWVLALCHTLGLTPDERRQLRAIEAACEASPDDP